MDCRDARELLDSFLAQELLVETNHELLRHVSGCADCKADLDGRARLRSRLKEAFTRAADLQVRPDFAEAISANLRASSSPSGRRWLPLSAAAAAILLIAIASAYMLRGRPADLAAQAAGDHQNCAVKFGLKEKPISLEEAAARYDPAYAALRTSPPDVVSTPAGTVRAVERHSCVFQNRRFGHVVLRLDQHLVSFLMTADDGRSSGPAGQVSLLAPVHGLSVASFTMPGHVVYIVSDLQGAAFRDVAQSLSGSKVASLIAFPIPPGN